jgi:hypothetical protein
MSEPKSPKQQLPRWLKRTQEGSWEPEILISGIVLLALTQVPRLLDQLHYWLEERTSMFFFYTSDVDDIVFDTLKLSTRWLVAGLIIHLILRSLWISYVGLSFAFPKGIQLDKLKMQPWFKNRLGKLNNFQEGIIRLENLCSSIYATAFLFVMASVSLGLFLSFMLMVGITIATIWPQLVNSDGSIDQILSIFTLVFAVPYLIDFITLGWVKRLPYFWWVYRYIYRFMGVITLAPVYRGIYYGLITNISRWKFVSLLVGYMVLTFVLVMPDGFFPGAAPSVYVKTLGISSIDGYYRDQPAERYSTWAHIQSAQITDGVLHVFLPHKRQFEAKILESCDAHLRTKGILNTFEKEDDRNLACLASVYSFYIDGKVLPASRFFMRELEQTGQLGLETWIDIAHLPRGAYALEVKVSILDAAGETAALIPFFHASDAVPIQPSAELSNTSSDSTSLK